MIDPAIVDSFYAHFVEITKTNFLLSDWFVVIKGFIVVFILSVFEYHKQISTSRTFRSKYPNLYSKLNVKVFKRNKWMYALLPFCDIYFMFLLFRNRYTTVAFLKAFALPKPNNLV